MKDIHGERPTPGRIPVVSPTLHCVAMTALVYLRSSFGLTLFRPRTIFFAFSVAVSVLDYIAWHEPDIWRDYRAVCIFAGGALVLYWLHFGFTLVCELLGKSEPDDYSGTSHFVRLLAMLGLSAPGTEMNVHLWLEPAAVLLFAAILRFALSEEYLSTWLVVVAGCMSAKEVMNYWTEIRRKKIAEDITADAKKRGEELSEGQGKTEAPQAARVAGQTIQRNVVLTEKEFKARRLAEALGIEEPYDLEEAETNYRERIQREHPDTHGNSPENHRRSVELNEAIEFFREELAR